MATNNSEKKSTKPMWIWVVIVFLLIALILSVTLGLYYSLKETSGGDNGNGNGNNNGEITVTWKDGDNILEVDENVKKGEIPHYDGPIVIHEAATEEWIYDFGWDKPLEPVTQSITFQTVFERKPNNLRYEYRESDDIYAAIGFKEGHEADKEVIIGSYYNDPDGRRAPIGAVGEAAFAGQDDASPVERILIADNLKNIEAQGFYNSANLTTIDWSIDYSQLSTIGSEAFTQIQVRDLVLPAAVTQINMGAFENAQFQSVTLSPDLTELSARIFNGCTELQQIDLPPKLEKIGEQAFNGCAKLPKIVIPPSVKQIDNHAFADCVSLQEVTFAENSQLEKIGDSVFQHADKLEAIVLPDSLTEWGIFVFRYCAALKSVNIPTGVTTIPLSTFFACTALESIYIPDNIEQIHQAAFSEAGLITVYIPASVTTVDAHVFENCQNLTSVSSGVAAPADGSNVPEGWNENWLEGTNITTVDWDQSRP